MAEVQDQLVATGVADEVASTSNMSPAPLNPTLPTFKQSYITNADRVMAAELMMEQRLKDGKDKKNKKSEPFTYKEANPVLNRIVADTKAPSPGLVQALLEAGANVSIERPKSTRFWKIVVRKDQKERRSDLLAQATKTCGVEVVWILTQNADETAKNEALPFAMRQNEPIKAHILTEAGADSGPQCEEFLRAVDSDWDEMIAVILPAAKGPCQSCRDKGLVKAANRGSARNLQILLSFGANADFESAAAMQKAVSDGREDLAAAIATCAKPPSPSSLDIAIDIAYTALVKDAEKRDRVIKTCLEAGGKGTMTDQTLVEACKSGQGRLVDILLTHCASVDHSAGAAMKFAVNSKNSELLRTLLRGRPSNATMAVVIPHAMALDDLSTGHEIIDILLSAGLRGDSVAESLINAIETGFPGGGDAGHLDLIRLHLEKGAADVNFNGGKSTVLAVRAGRANVLTLLLQHNPSVDTLNAAFPGAVALVDPVLRLEIATMVLEAGAKGKVVDDALVVSASTGKCGAGLTSAILKQSTVDYDGGEPLVVAVQSRCLEQMVALLGGNPSVSTVTAAWAAADVIDDDDAQLATFEVLLSTGSVDASLQDRSLVVAATRGQRGLPICALLLKYQASPERLDAAAVVAAAKGLHLDTLALLAGSVASATAFITAFDAFFSEGEQWLQPRGLEIVHFLLGHGAAGPVVDAAFCMAVRLYEPDAVELLATSITPEVVNVALALAVNASDDWMEPDDRNLWLIHSLLEWGDEQECVDAAFLKAVDAHARGVTSEALVDTFLAVGPSKANANYVNYQNGEALQIAIRNGKPALLKKLASHGATEHTMSLAFAETIIATLEDEDIVISLVDVLANNPTAKPDFKTPPKGYQPPLFAGLAAHPQWAKLVTRLIELGCDLETPVEHFLYDDEDVGAEPATVLAWALSQPEKGIGSAAIGALIDGKADVKFTAKVCKTTPLMLAAKNARSDIVAKLIKAKANISARDRFDRSALFYASRIGDLESVNALLKAKSPLNDGSLQEAAKNLHSLVVAALIKGKHSPDFPSSKEQHQGRTAMQEMALMCDASASEPTEMEATVRAILKGKPNLLEKVRGKNALFLALDNVHPVPITTALLNCAMWEHINKPDNVYVEVDPETGTKYYFSPTTYVARGFSQGMESQNQALLNILRDKRCEDRYYAEEGAEQPDDAVGMPQAIIDAERKRKDHEEKLRKKELEHQLKLLHTKQEAELKEVIEHQKMEMRNMVHRQQLEQSSQKAAQNQDNIAMTNQLKMQLHEEAEAAKRKAAKARADFEEEQKTRMAQMRAANLMRENALKADFAERANARKLTLQQRQNRLAAAAGERKLLTAQKLAETHAAEARHKVEVKARQNALALELARGTAAHKREQHEMRMQEMRNRDEHMKLKMLQQHFAGQQKNLSRITAG